MRIAATIRRTSVLLLSALTYMATIKLLGLRVELTSMSKFFGHALIYAGSTALIVLAFTIIERLFPRRQEPDLYIETMAEIKAEKSKGRGEDARIRGA